MCPKFQRVLASRACRSAVMIGTPLTTIQIQKVSERKYFMSFKALDFEQTFSN